MNEQARRTETSLALDFVTPACDLPRIQGALRRILRPEACIRTDRF